MTEFMGDRPEAGDRDGAGWPTEQARRPVFVLLVGDRQDVLETIKNLQRRGFAPAGEWSRPLPWRAVGETTEPQLLTIPPGSVMSICTRYLT